MSNIEMRPGFPTGLIAAKRSEFTGGVDTVGLLNDGLIEHGPDAIMTVPTNSFDDDQAVPSSLRYNEETDEFEGAYLDGWRGLGGATGRWETPVAAPSLNTVPSRGYLVDTRTAVTSVILPLATKVGQAVSFADLYGTFSQYPLTVQGNGKNIYGAGDDLVISTKNCALTFTWTGDVRGWIVTQAVGLGQGMVYNRVLFEQSLTTSTDSVTLAFPSPMIDVYVNGLRLASSKFVHTDDSTVTFTPALTGTNQLMIVEYTPVKIAFDNGFADLSSRTGALEGRMGTAESNITAFSNPDDLTLGDGKIAVKQPVAGATARTQHDKNSDLISIKDFAVTGLGIVNETINFNIAVSSGRSLYVPDGTYILSANSIVLPSNTVIEFSPNANVQWVDTTAGGDGQVSWGFKLNNVSNVKVTGGHHIFSADTLVVFAIGSGVSYVYLEDTTVTGARFLDVVDGVNVYADSTPLTRSNNICVFHIRGKTVTRSTTSSFITFRYSERCLVDRILLDGYYYGVMWWGGDSNPAINGEVGNERKCKNISISNVFGTVVWAGAWGSMGDNIKITNCSFTALDSTHSDVGIDFEGCTNSSAMSCYACDFENGNLATFFYCNQIAFVDCDSVVTNANARLLRFNNSGQNVKNTDLLVTNCRFKAVGVVSLVNQNGAANNLIFSNNTLINAFVVFIANNNGYIEVTKNTFNFDAVPTLTFNNYGVYAALAVGAFHSGGSSASGAVPAAKSVIKDNWFRSQVNFPTPAYAMWILHVGFNNSSHIEITGGGTLSAGFVNDIGLANGSANAGTTLRYTINNFEFFNKTWTTELVNTATQYPKGTVGGITNLGLPWPNAITDNSNYASVYFDVRQKFEALAPTTTKVGDMVITAGIGTAAVTRTY